LGPAAAAAGDSATQEVPVKLRGQKVLDRPGFMEIDLVSHSGGGNRELALHLVATDLCTG